MSQRVTSHHRNRGNSSDRRKRLGWLWANYLHRCHWCGTELPTPADADVDRLEAGGSYGFSAPYPNVRLSCIPCNRGWRAATTKKELATV